MKTGSKVFFGGILVIIVGFFVYWFENKGDTQQAIQNTNTETNTLPETTPTNTSTSSSPVSASIYKNGSYNVTTDYMTPAGKETLGVNISVNSDKVSSVEVTNMASDKTSKNYQNRFIASIQSQILGKTVDTASVGVISGASLTSNAFNQALMKIKAEAKI